MTIVSGAEDLAAVACPFARTADHLDILYVTLPAGFGTGEWLTLIAHAARTFEQIEGAIEAQRQLEAKIIIERPTGSFRRAFSYAGGRFFVMPHSRPASTGASPRRTASRATSSPV